MEDDEKVIGLAILLKWFFGAIFVVFAMRGVYALIWGEWQILRLCLTVVVTYGFFFGFREWFLYKKGKK